MLQLIDSVTVTIYLLLYFNVTDERKSLESKITCYYDAMLQLLGSVTETIYLLQYYYVITNL